MNEKLMSMAVELALKSIDSNNGGPFGAVIAKGDQVIGRGVNRVTSDVDPTAHAEINAIRQACRALNRFSLQGFAIYTSCEPCPMCLGAIYWARLDRVYFGASRHDAARINFDDDKIYREFNLEPQHRTLPMIQGMRDECLKLFDRWLKSEDRVHY